MLQCVDGDQEQEHDDELADTEEEVNQACFITTDLTKNHWEKI